MSNVATDIINTVDTHHFQAEALQRLLRFVTEANAQDLAGGDVLNELWVKYMLAPITWNELPAVNTVIEQLTALYLDRMATARADAHAVHDRARGAA